MDFISQVSYYGNPHSRTHQYGWESEKAMEVAREQVTLYKQTEPSGYIYITNDESDYTDHSPRLLIILIIFPGCWTHRSGSEGDYLDKRRHRVEQYRSQGSGQILQGQEEARPHNAN